MHVTYLLADAIDRDRLSQHRGDGEPGDSSLVLKPELRVRWMHDCPTTTVHMPEIRA